MFKRCNYPRAAPNERPPRPPLSEHGGNALVAEECGAALLVASAAFAAKEHLSVDEDPLFSTAVNGLMALFGSAVPAPVQSSWSALASTCADAAEAEETDDGAYSTAPAMPTRAPGSCCGFLS